MVALDCVKNKVSSSDSVNVFTVNMNSNTSINEPKRDPESQLFQTDTRGGRNMIWALAVDLPILLAVLVVVGLYEFQVIPQHKAGFYCNDPALSFRFTGDTVSMGLIVSSVFLLPLVVVVATEAMLYQPSADRSRYKHVLCKSLGVYRYYAYGLFVNFVLVEVMKGIAGNPRPMFFDVCEPDAAKTCTGSQYVTEFQCTSTKYSTWMQIDSYRSFPSGHTSLSVLCGFFTAWYLQKRAFSWRSRTVCLVPLLQILCISYSAICSLTRMTDHRHHWWDVLVGAVIGFGSLFYTIIISNNYEGRRKWRRDRAITASQQTVQTS